jgi:hypothetical protein
MATYKKWSNTEIQFIKDNISSFSDLELAQKLSQMTGENISCSMIRRQRRKVGVVKQRGRRRKNSNLDSALPS